MKFRSKLYRSAQFFKTLTTITRHSIVRGIVLCVLLTSAGWTVSAAASWIAKNCRALPHLQPVPAPNDPWVHTSPIETVAIEKLSFQWGALRFDNLSTLISIKSSGKTKFFELKECRIKKLSFSGNSPLQRIALENLTAAARVSWNGEDNRLTVEACEIHLPPSGIIRGRGALPIGHKGGFLHVEGSDLPIGPTLARLFHLAEDFSVNAPTGMKLELTMPTCDQLKFVGTVKVFGGIFQDPSFAYAAENLTVSLDMKGSWDLAHDTGNVEGYLSLTTGEMLAGKMYLDFTETPLHLEMNLLFDSLTKLRVSNLSIFLEPIWSARCKGSIADLPDLSGLDFYCISPLHSVGTAWNKWIKDPFGGVYPALQGMQLDGRWRSQASLEGSLADPEVRGSFRLEDVSFFHPDYLTDPVTINSDFPFWFAPVPVAPSKDPRDGRKGLVQLDNIKLPWLNTDSLTMVFEAPKNGWKLLNDVTLPIGKDQLKINRLELNNAWLPDRSGMLVILSNGLGLGPILEYLWEIKLDAALTSPKLTFRLDNNRLECLDAIDMEVLSGDLRVENLLIDRLLSPGRVISLSAFWQDVDLQELTHLTDFGEITGRLKGQVNDLQISYGTPVAFDLLLESVPRPGVAQQISLVALENLTALGGGESPFMGLAGGVIGTFFKDFSYQKIGIRCILKNDFFTIRGLIEEDATEYLVKRGLTGVNVINQQTNNRISWNDMIRRLERINRTAEQGDPPRQGEGK